MTVFTDPLDKQVTEAELAVIREMTVAELRARCSVLFNHLQDLDHEQPPRDDPDARLELFRLELREHQLTRPANCDCHTCGHVNLGPCGCDCQTCKNYSFCKDVYPFIEVPPDWFNEAPWNRRKRHTCEMKGCGKPAINVVCRDIVPSGKVVVPGGRYFVYACEEHTEKGFRKFRKPYLVAKLVGWNI